MATVKDLEARIVAMQEQFQAQQLAATQLQEAFQALSQRMEAIEQAFNSAQGIEQGPENLGERILALENVISGRNKSAPTKRNMTDADAMRVLNGDLKDLPHKEAAESAGLTYAQVYSARLAYTFKHVHRTLEQGGWRASWTKA